MIQEYLAYLKDNPKRYWFKRKLYGWGWTPATWEGWLIILVYVGLIVVAFKRIDAYSHSASDTLIPVSIVIVLLSLILIGICFWKGEKPRWQWGVPKNEDKH